MWQSNSSNSRKWCRKFSIWMSEMANHKNESCSVSIGKCLCCYLISNESESIFDEIIFDEVCVAFESNGFLKHSVIGKCIWLSATIRLREKRWHFRPCQSVFDSSYMQPNVYICFPHCVTTVAGGIFNDKIG